jgi:hypothetical protein
MVKKTRLVKGKRDNLLYIDDTHYIQFDADLNPHGVMRIGKSTRYFYHGEELPGPLPSVTIFEDIINQIKEIKHEIYNKTNKN